jgi:hypothetical protein
MFLDELQDVGTAETARSAASAAQPDVRQEGLYPSAMVLDPRDVYGEHSGYFMGGQKVIGTGR